VKFRDGATGEAQRKLPPNQPAYPPNHDASGGFENSASGEYRQPAKAACQALVERPPHSLVGAHQAADQTNVAATIFLARSENDKCADFLAQGSCGKGHVDVRTAVLVPRDRNRGVRMNQAVNSVLIRTVWRRGK